MLAIDEATGYVWITVLTTTINLVRRIDDLLRWIRNQYHIPVKAIRIDQEGHLAKISYEDGFHTSQLEELLRHWGIAYEQVPKATPAQGGGYERAGGVVITKARTMIISAHLPASPDMARSNQRGGNVFKPNPKAEKSLENSS